MNKLLKTQLILSSLIILVSFIYGLPNIIMINKLGSDYNPLVISDKSPIARDEAFAYAPFVNYILKGNLFLKEAYVAEYADGKELYELINKELLSKAVDFMGLVHAKIN